MVLSQLLDFSSDLRRIFSDELRNHRFVPYFFLNFQDAQRNLDAEIEALLNVEKQIRLAGDVSGTKKAVTDILQLCFEARAWKTLNDQIVLLSKRRGQLKQVNEIASRFVRILLHFWIEWIINGSGDFIPFLFNLC